MLTQELKGQLSQYLQLLENPLVFSVSLDDSDSSKEVKEFLGEVVDLSDKLSIKEEKIRTLF